MNCYLRDALKEDIDLLFQWTNEPMVRKNSFSQHNISFIEHQEWFNNIFENKNCKQYIFIVDECAVGQVRITVTGEVAEIGYSVSKEHRSLGYGRKMLELIREKVWEDFPVVKKIIGSVKCDNIASKKAFLGAGYEEAYTVYEIQKRVLS